MNKVFTFMRESQTAMFLIPFGLVFMFFGIVVLVFTLNSQNYIKIEATIAKIEEVEEDNVDSDGNNNTTTIYNATVNYTVDGKKYTQTLDNIPKHKVGDKIGIYYNPKDPSKIVQSKNIIVPIVLIIGGIVALIAGITSAVNSVKRHKKMKEQERSWANG